MVDNSILQLSLLSKLLKKATAILTYFIKNTCQTKPEETRYFFGTDFTSFKNRHVEKSDL